MTIPMKQPPAGDIMEQVLIKGDVGKLTPDERVKYYDAVCKSIGLNPLTKPFDYIVLNGKMQLYALRAATDQLRKMHGVSVEVVSRDVADDILTIHVRAKMPDGRADEDFGAVFFPSTLKGDNRANAELKCVTKAKRRATLSICGLGWLDETEVEDIPAGAKREPPKAAPNVMLPPHDPQTGELLEQNSPHVTSTANKADPPQNSDPEQVASPEGGSADNLESEVLMKYDDELAKAAETGDIIALQSAWKLIPKQHQPMLKAGLDRRHKPRCNEVAAELLRT